MGKVCMQEEVVLVDEKNRVLGTMPKAEAHHAKTPLHRGFSLFLFNEQGELLLQQRSHEKKTWPGIWSNSCCGHPALNESNTDAAKRRLAFELGMGAAAVEEAAPYRYQFEHLGIRENEICPILIGRTTGEPRPNPAEVAATRWMNWEEFLTDTKKHPDAYAPWCVEEAAILASGSRLREFLARGRSKEHSR